MGTFYGQAPSSIIYLGFGVFRGEGTVAAGGLFQGSSRVARFNRDVVAHETAHQWWGSLVANANARNYWFIETMAELASAIYVERTVGRREYDQKVADWRRACLDNRSEVSVQDSTVIWAGDGGNETTADIYAKGPYVFHMFRSTFGDEKFLTLLQEMAEALQHKNIGTRDIQDMMEKVVGGNMSWFFDQWIRGVGIPQYALKSTSRRNEQGKWIVEGTIRQRVLYGKNRTPMPGVFFRGVAPLTFVTPRGRELKSTRSILVEGPETRFRVIVTEEPARVFFNKDGEILAEDTLIDRSW
jgi:aminopeptidase N